MAAATIQQNDDTCLRQSLAETNNGPETLACQDKINLGKQDRNCKLQILNTMRVTASFSNQENTATAIGGQR